MTRSTSRNRAGFRCTDCGHTVGKWVGRCPSCGSWGTIPDTPETPAATPSRTGVSSRARALTPSSPAVPISRIDPAATRALPSGIGELDRVLGSGVVPGSVVLLAGEPGVGKSTLLLEVAGRWAGQPADTDRDGGGCRTALYVTAEESAGQVRLRAERTGALRDTLFLAAESDLGTILGHVEQVRPSLVVVDSVQTISTEDADGVTGGVTQTRAVTSALTALAKTTGITVLLVGHVTKDGNVAGPRVLEHLVDVVLHFEGDRHSSLRMIRGVKNRFGASDEVGCFEMRDDGIREVPDPSGIFLHHRDTAVPGTAVSVTMDGKRALLGELQALVAPTEVPTPRRAVSGIDNQRVAMILAVLERRCAIPLGRSEVYVATVGGMKVSEPAVDLAIALAVASARSDRVAPPGTVVIGEVGLAGEVRRVGGMSRRLAEAARLGFRRAIVPDGTEESAPGIHTVPVPDVGSAVAMLR